MEGLRTGCLNAVIYGILHLYQRVQLAAGRTQKDVR